jgi:dolichol-phosphate mannosyltransferase
MQSGPGAPSLGPRPTVSIVLATLNERENLPELLPRIVRQPLPPFEVIIVDDGSSDGTREFATEQAHRDPRIRPIFHDGKQTTLRAQCQGIAAARGDYVVIMDADMQHPPEQLPPMVRELERGAGVVVASRYAPGGSPGRRTLLRALLSRGAEAIAKILLPEARRVTDPVSGFFGFRREVFLPLNPRYRGYKLLLFVLAMNRGGRFAEVGFLFEPRTRGSSKVVQRSSKGTQRFAFIRVFLAEAVLARRFERELRQNPPASRPQSPPGSGTTSIADTDSAGPERSPRDDETNSPETPISTHS